MPSSPNNVKIGACSVNFKTIDMGLTKGGVEITSNTAKKKINVDQFGETEINEYITGVNVSVKVPMAESDLTILQQAVPSSTLVTDATTPLKKKLEIRTGVGISLRDVAAGKLVLHPIGLPITNKLEDFTIPICAPSGELSFAFKYDEERVYNIEFVGYPNATLGGLLYVFGDESATA
jgi:hypothetical protein